MQTLNSELQLSQGVSELFSKPNSAGPSGHVWLPNDCSFRWITSENVNAAMV